MLTETLTEETPVKMETQVFGLPETKTKAEEKPQLETENKPAEAEQINQEADDKKAQEETKVDSQKKEEPKEQVVAEEKKPEKKEQAENKPTFKVEFNDKKTEEAQKTEQPKETLAYTDEGVLKFLKTKGVEVENLSEIGKKQTLNEEVEKFRKFNEETGLGAAEFFNSQRDWKAESSENRIREFLKFKNPNLSKEDIETQLELISVDEEQAVDMSDRELKRAKLEYNKMDAEALQFLSKISEDYKTPKKAATKEPQKLTPEQIAETHRPYWNSRDKSLDELNEISFSIKGIGEIKVPVAQEQKELVRQNTETLESFINRWKSKEGSLNTNDLVRDSLFSTREFQESFIQAVVEQTHALTLENYSKENRAVNLNDAAKNTRKINTNGALIVEGGKKSDVIDKKFGKSIV